MKRAGSAQRLLIIDKRWYIVFCAMPREIITVQVGQCGNQIGSRFWDVILKEHAEYNPDGVFNEPLSSFFYNCDPKTGQEIPICGGTSKIRGLKARSVLIDSEEGVLQHVLRSKLGELFSGGHFIKDSSGAGNNWAVGYNEYCSAVFPY